MKKAILLGAILCMAVSVQAGIVSVDVAVDLEQVPQSIDVPGFQQFVTINPDGSADVGILESFLQHFPGTLIFTVETNGDPVMHVSKEVENATDVPWTSYQVQIGGEGVSFVSGSAWSDKFTIISEPDATTLLFSQPLPVNPDETVAFEFDLLIEQEGLFNFCLCQTPIPEPASMALLGLGWLLTIRRKK